MPYTHGDFTQTMTILGIAFVVGAIAQFIKQKVDKNKSDNDILWLSLGSGLSAMIIIGMALNYTEISPSFLMAISGIAGWAGIALLTTLVNLFNAVIETIVRGKFNVTGPIQQQPTQQIQTRKEVVDDEPVPKYPEFPDGDEQ